MARSPARPVTEQDLAAAVAELEAFYQTQDDAIQHTRDVVEFKNAIPIDDAYKTTGYVVRDETATDHVLATGMMLTVNRPKLQLLFEGASQEKQRLVAKLEPALEALILDDAGHKGQTYQRIGMALAQDGGAWSSIVADLDAWKGPGGRYSVKRKQHADDDGYPTEKGSKSGDEKYVDAVEEAKRGARRCVLDWRPLDAKTVNPVWLGEYELGAMFVVTEHPCFSTLAEHGLVLDREGNLVDEAIGQPMPAGTRSVTETVRKVEHWTAKTVTYFLQYKQSVRKIDQWNHNYGFIPFVVTYGWRLPHWTSLKVGWGSAGVMLPSVEYLSYLKTLHANQAAGSIAPPFKRTVPLGGDPVRDPQNPGKTLPTTQLLPNVALNLAPGEDIQPIMPAQSNPHLREQIAMVQERLEQLRGPVASGNLNDAQNGYAIEAIKSDRRVKSNAYIAGLQDHLEQVTDFALRLLRDKIRETVWVRPRQDKSAGWMSIPTEALKDTPLVSWDVSPEQPSGAIVEARHWHERLAAGTAGPDQAITALGDNPQDIYEDQLRAEVRKDPAIHQLALAETFAEYARGDLLERYTAAQQQAQTGMVAPPGMAEMLGGAGAAGLGQGGIPGDTGSLTMSPNGQGAAPISPQAAGIAGPVAGMPGGGGFSSVGGQAGIQSLE